MKSKPQSQQGKRFNHDALIIGAGLAGLTYALELSKLKAKAKIALIVKKSLVESNSFYAQGGVAADKQNDTSSHVNDTLKAGGDLSHRETVTAILHHAEDVVKNLIAHGVPFSKEDNEYTLAKEGGHSKRRIFHAGDETGKAIINTLIEKIKCRKNIHIFEHHTAIDLMTQNELHTPGDLQEAIGAYILDEKKGKVHTFLAKTTVLATGGAGKVYRYTSNPETATGDGIAMAFRAGARVGNLEFFQFHPTVLYHPKLNNFLMTEALRGEGARLLNADTLKPFMQHYAPKEKELATRDIVSRAIFNEIEKGKHNFVYLDIRHHSKDYLAKRFPAIFNTLLTLDIDMSQDLIPVVPAAHYLCGGVLTNIEGQTDLKRLYIIGETAFTGLHGANRLASNSLLECLVMGKLAAKKSAEWLAQPFSFQHHIQDWDSQHVTDLRRGSQINTHWRGLRGEMTSYAGIVRTEAGLKDLLNLIVTRRKMIENYYHKHTITRDIIELRNIVSIAKLIVTAALNRKESRGGHYREDYPEKNAIAKDSVLRAKEMHFYFRE